MQQFGQSELDAIVKYKTENKAYAIPNDIKDDISGKTLEQSVDIIRKQRPAENGGLIAISGFYFQFLVTILYMVELLEGKWTDIIIEYHQDIIACNNKKVRFIQAKTKSEKVVEVSKCDLYREWVPKLIKLASFYKDKTEIKSEFQLVTNFIIKDSPQITIENHLYNENYEGCKPVESLVKKVKKYSREKDGEFDYESRCGQSLEALLEKFSITPKMDNFIDIVRQRISDYISLPVIYEDIDMLIGMICKICSYSDDNSILFINQEKAMRMINKVKMEAISRCEVLVEQNSTNKVIEKTITYMHHELSSPQPVHYLNELINELEEYEFYLKEDLCGSITLDELLNKFIDRKDEISLRVRTMNSEMKFAKLLNLFKIGFLLRIIFKRELHIYNSIKNILIKKTPSCSLAFLDFDSYIDYKECLAILKTTINNLEKKDIIDLIINKHISIFQGDFDDSSFNRSEKVVIDDIVINPFDGEHMDIGSFAKVVTSITVVNGNRAISSMLRAKGNYTDYNNFKAKIEEIWSELVL
jgi:hypothetical protein